MEGWIRSDGLFSGVLSEDINVSETAIHLDILRVGVIIRGPGRGRRKKMGCNRLGNLRQAIEADVA